MRRHFFELYGTEKNLEAFLFLLADIPIADYRAASLRLLSVLACIPSGVRGFNDMNLVDWD
jgi:hypothetical protein